MQTLPSFEKCLSHLSKTHSIFEVYKNQNAFLCCLRLIRLLLAEQAPCSKKNIFGNLLFRIVFE